MPLAIVEFIEPSEARKAFTRLAYTKFKNLPLYLEWAPDNCLTVKINSINEANNNNNNGNTKKLPQQEEDIKMNNQKNIETVKSNDNEDENEDDDDTPEPDTTLFVKNLNFTTTDEDLYQVKKHLFRKLQIFAINLIKPSFSTSHLAES